MCTRTRVKGWERRRIWRTERSSEGGQVEHVLARGESDSREYRNTISLPLSFVLRSFVFFWDFFLCEKSSCEIFARVQFDGQPILMLFTRRALNVSYWSFWGLFCWNVSSTCFFLDWDHFGDNTGQFESATFCDLVGWNFFFFWYIIECFVEDNCIVIIDR